MFLKGKSYLTTAKAVTIPKRTEKIVTREEETMLFRIIPKSGPLKPIKIKFPRGVDADSTKFKFGGQSIKSWLLKIKTKF
jgi:hypothetical protein